MLNKGPHDLIKLPQNIHKEENNRVPIMCVDLAFGEGDNERIEVYEGADLREGIESMFMRRGIDEQALKDKIFEIVE